MTYRKFWYYWHTRNDSDSRNGWNTSHSGHSGSWDRHLLRRTKGFLLQKRHRIELYRLSWYVMSGFDLVMIQSRKKERFGGKGDALKSA